MKTSSPTQALNAINKLLTTDSKIVSTLVV